MSFRLDNLCAGYGMGGMAVKGLSLNVAKGEVLCMLGRNGAGKTTTLKAIMGLIPERSGELMLNGRDISNLATHRMAAAGIGYVPQGRRLFAELTVRENLEVGAYTLCDRKVDFNHIFELFPVLRERLSQVSATLSGGEQQMLAMARALCLEPDLLLLDEPSEGLMPAMISTISETIRQLSKQGVSILMVEQRIDVVRAVADRVAFLENGILKKTITIQQLADSTDELNQYMGI